MVIRVLVEDDAAACRALRAEALRTEPLAFGADYESYQSRTVEDVRKQLAANDNVFTLGAFINDDLVGMVNFSRPTNPKFHHAADLNAMFVAELARGKGVGKALVFALLDEARKQDGLEQIFLAVSTSQTAAIALYRSVGFETWGVQKDGLRANGMSADLEHMCYTIQSDRLSF